jgi:primosomal protein N' (replication factor Y)
MADPLFAPASAGTVRVALPVPVDALFDYAVPPDLAAEADPGCRAHVTFRDRRLTGVIVERGTGSRPPQHMRDLEKVIDPEPVLSASMLAILREAAAEVLCPIGIALATAVPSGSAPRRIPGFAITARGREALRSRAVRGPERAALEALAARPRSVADLRRRSPGAPLPALERDGLVARESLERGRPARPGRVRVMALSPDVDCEAAVRERLVRAPRQAAILRRLAHGGPTPRTVLGREFPRASAPLRALAAQGLVTESEQPLPAAPPLCDTVEAGGPVVLTAHQEAALAPIDEAIRARRFETVLLHGVTGSGKTEVYLRAVEAALGESRQALVLVPEITLTHQMVARLRARFGDRVAVLHSGLPPRQRLEQWQRLRNGSTPIALGARSALFAPLDDLGLIVIDEEHDAAYKNEEGFRYHARSLAARRAAAARCPLVLGSATPSLETRFAADRGALRRVVLPDRIGSRPMPAVSIVDLGRARRLAASGERTILSRELRRAMGRTLAEGGQTILFLNRRGFSTQILCFDCGYAERCPHCDIALVYHAPEQRLRCHYCDHAAPLPEVCSGCGAPDTALLGVGTQRVEEEVRIHFPHARTARLDRDTARRRGFVEQVLRDVQRRRIDVLVGTQLIAKGHDYPGVRLVGVVLADIGLHLPDFRAAERTFQLLTQVAGRAGRDAAPGQVIVQSLVPDHYAIRPVLDHDFEGFYREELGHRSALGYPPFGRLVHVVVAGTEAEQVRGAAGLLADSLAPAEDVEVLGPAPAALARLRGRHRVQLLVKGADDAAVRCAAECLTAAARRLPHGVQASVDTNPVNML